MRLFSLIAATVILAGIYFGVSQRRRPRIHVPVMLSCFFADLLMVLFIELNRHAIAQALHSKGLLAFHVTVSVIALLCWFVAVYSGLQQRKGRCRRLHRVNAVVFLTCRTANWVTAFMI